MSARGIINADILIRDMTLVAYVGNLLYFLMPFPQLVWRLLLVMLSLFVILVRRRRFTSVEICLLAIALVNLVYYLIAFLQISGTPSTTHIGNTLCAVLPVSLFAYLASRGVMTRKFVSVMTICLLVASVGFYFNYQNTLIETYNLDVEEKLNKQVNASTAFLMIIPLLFLEKKNILFYVEMSLCTVFLLMSVKRGNILAAAGPLALLVFYKFRNSSKAGIVLALAGIAVAGFFLTKYLILENEFFLSRVDDTLAGDTSNRSDIYSDTFALWMNADVFHTLFGYGYHALTRINGIMAHSDWLEILGDNGLVGLALYLVFFVSFWKTVRFEKYKAGRYILLAAFLIWGLKSIYSMMYVSDVTSILAVAIGLAIGYRNQPQLYEEFEK